jgi:hypothetical protein
MGDYSVKDYSVAGIILLFLVIIINIKTFSLQKFKTN